MKAEKDVYEVSKDGKSVKAKVDGTFFVTKDTYSMVCRVRGGKGGIKKYHGCVMFRGLKSYYGKFISQARCIARFNDKCPGSSAWLVVPVGKDWHWYRVDGEIKFS